MRALVIANCQALPLANMLSLLCEELEVDQVQVHQLSIEKIQSFVDTKSASYDIIFAFRVSSAFGAFEQSVLKSNFPRATIFFLTNMHFLGLHPDLTYIGNMHERCTGLLGDYHSKIALVAYMTGRSLSEACRLFSDDTYEQARYYDEFDSSLVRLKQGDEQSDVSILNEFKEHLRFMPLMLSVNHPTSAYFYLYAFKIAQTLMEQGLVRRVPSRWHPLMYPNLLADSAVFPIYPQIAERHGLNYAGSTTYKSHSEPGRFGKLYDLDGYLTGEYDAFQRFGRDGIERSSQWPEIKRQFAV